MKNMFFIIFWIGGDFWQVISGEVDFPGSVAPCSSLGGWAGDHITTKRTMCHRVREPTPSCSLCARKLHGLCSGAQPLGHMWQWLCEGDGVAQMMTFSSGIFGILRMEIVWIGVANLWLFMCCCSFIFFLSSCLCLYLSVCVCVCIVRSIGFAQAMRFDYSVRQKIGYPGAIKLRTILPQTSVLPKLPQLPYKVKHSSFSWKPSFFQVHSRVHG